MQYTTIAISAMTAMTMPMMAPIASTVPLSCGALGAGVGACVTKFGAADTTPGIVVDSLTAAATSVAFSNATTSVTRLVAALVVLDTRVMLVVAMPVRFDRACANC